MKLLNKQKITYYTTILLELVILLFLVSYILIKVVDGNTNTNSTTINKNNVQFLQANELKYFYEWKPNQTIMYERPWLPRTIIKTTNNDGLIGNTNYPIPPPPNTYRIIALGDSFTEGLYVDNAETYPKQLETKLNTELTCPGIDTFEILNFGVGGYDIEYAANRYLLRGNKYQPNLILWFLKDDDFFELSDIGRTRVEQYTKQIFMEEQGDITRFPKYQSIDTTLLNPQISLGEKLWSVVRKELLHEMNQKQYVEIQTKAIHRIAETTKAQILLVTFDWTNPEYKKRMNAWSQTEQNVQLYDGLRDIYALNASFKPNDGHPNPQGYTIISDDIFRYLKTDILNTCLQVETRTTPTQIIH